MIAFEVLAVLAIAYRIWTRRFMRAEAVALSVVATNFLMVWAQIVICDGRPFPERRYWDQADLVLLGWTAWAFLELGRLAAAHVRRVPVVSLIALVTVAFAAVLVVMLVKPHVPGSRRHAYVQACAWAESRIRADWKGPAADAELLYDDIEYHLSRRPSLSAHTGLLAYRLGGRHASPSKFGAIDLPDYVFDEEREIELPEGARYELMEKVRFGRRTFALYKRTDGDAS